jgi:hypothetical protein
MTNTSLAFAVLLVALAVIVILAVYSIMPGLVDDFECPSDDGAWSDSCRNLKLQSSVVPVLITLSIIIAAAVLIVPRMRV